MRDPSTSLHVAWPTWRGRKVFISRPWRRNDKCNGMSLIRLRRTDNEPIIIGSNTSLNVVLPVERAKYAGSAGTGPHRRLHHQDLGCLSNPPHRVSTWVQYILSVAHIAECLDDRHLQCRGVRWYWSQHRLTKVLRSMKMPLLRLQEVADFHLILDWSNSSGGAWSGPRHRSLTTLSSMADQNRPNEDGLVKCIRSVVHESSYSDSQLPITQQAHYPT